MGVRSEEGEGAEAEDGTDGINGVLWMWDLSVIIYRRFAIFHLGGNFFIGPVAL